MTIDHLPPLREVIAANGLDARKSLGQNFLLDLNLTSKIARSAGDLSQVYVYEVGPGPGGLTRAILAQNPKHLIVVEKDQRCLNILEEISEAYPRKVTIVNDDALKQDEASLIPQGKAKIIANLPYNVGTALLVKWLTYDDWLPWYENLTLMFQKEVAERITAQPGTKSYGRLSVLAQWRAHTKKLFDVPPKAFTPPPKVTSSIVQITPFEPDTKVKAENLEKLTAAAFGKRRKMLRVALKSLVKDSETLLKAAEIDPTARAESLSVADFIRLTEVYEQSIQ